MRQRIETIERFLDRLLLPVKPPRGALGWVGLVANGAGGYWFEIFWDYVQALEITTGAVEDLGEQSAAGHLEERLAHLGADLSVRLRELRDALATPKK